MTLKGMRKADQQMILDTLGMGSTTTTTTSTTPVDVPVATGLESGPLGLTNTRLVFTRVFLVLICRAGEVLTPTSRHNPLALQYRRNLCACYLGAHIQVCTPIFRSTTHQHLPTLCSIRLAVPLLPAREIASKMENSMRTMTTNLQKLSFR